MSVLHQLLFGTATSDQPLLAWGHLCLRVFAGLAMALGHGMGKIPVSEGFIENTAGMGFPLPAFFAWAAALSEFVGGFLLAAGFLTRPAAFMCLCTMVVAALIAHADDPFSRKEKSLLFGFIFLQFVLTGAGRYSVDAWIRSRLRPSTHDGQGT